MFVAPHLHRVDENLAYLCSSAGASQMCHRADYSASSVETLASFETPTEKRAMAQQITEFPADPVAGRTTNSAILGADLGAGQSSRRADCRTLPRPSACSSNKEHRQSDGSASNVASPPSPPSRPHNGRASTSHGVYWRIVLFQYRPGSSSDILCAD